MPEKDQFNSALYEAAKIQGLPEDIDEDTFRKRVSAEPEFRKAAFEAAKLEGMPFDKNEFEKRVVDPSGPVDLNPMDNKATYPLYPNEQNPFIKPKQDNVRFGGTDTKTQKILNKQQSIEPGDIKGGLDVSLEKGKYQAEKKAAHAPTLLQKEGLLPVHNEFGEVSSANALTNIDRLIEHASKNYGKDPVFDEQLKRMAEDNIIWITPEQREEKIAAIDHMIVPEETKQLFKNQLYVYDNQDAINRTKEANRILMQSVKDDQFRKSKHSDTDMSKTSMLAIDALNPKLNIGMSIQNEKQPQSTLDLEDGLSTVFDTFGSKMKIWFPVIGIRKAATDIFDPINRTDPELRNKLTENFKQSLIDTFTKEGHDFRATADIVSEVVGKKLDIGTGTAIDVGSNLDYILSMMATSYLLPIRGVSLVDKTMKIDKALTTSQKLLYRGFKLGEEILKSGLTFEANNQLFYGGKGEGFATGAGEEIGRHMGHIVMGAYYRSAIAKALMGRGVPSKMSRFIADRFWTTAGEVGQEVTGDLLSGTNLSDLDSRYFSSIISMGLFSGSGYDINTQKKTEIFTEAANKAMEEAQKADPGLMNEIMPIVKNTLPISDATQVAINKEVLENMAKDAQAAKQNLPIIEKAIQEQSDIEQEQVQEAQQKDTETKNKAITEAAEKLSESTDEEVFIPDEQSNKSEVIQSGEEEKRNEEKREEVLIEKPDEISSPANFNPPQWMNPVVLEKWKSGKINDFEAVKESLPDNIRNQVDVIENSDGSRSFYMPELNRSLINGGQMSHIDAVSLMVNSAVEELQSYRKNNIKLQISNDQNRIKIGQDVAIKLANRLAKRINFSVNIIDRPDLKFSGAVTDRRITINTANVTLDTPFHEVMHPVIEDLKHFHPQLITDLYTELENDPRGREIIAETKKLYAKEDVITESIAQMVGEISAAKIDPRTGDRLREKFQEFWSALRQYLRDIFHVGYTVDLSDERLATFTLNDFANLIAIGESDIHIQGFGQKATDIHLQKASKNLDQSIEEFYEGIYKDVREGSKDLKSAATSILALKNKTNNNTESKEWADAKWEEIKKIFIANDVSFGNIDIPELNNLDFRDAYRKNEGFFLQIINKLYPPIGKENYIAQREKNLLMNTRWSNTVKDLEWYGTINLVIGNIGKIAVQPPQEAYSLQKDVNGKSIAMIQNHSYLDEMLKDKFINGELRYIGDKPGYIYIINSKGGIIQWVKGNRGSYKKDVDMSALSEENLFDLQESLWNDHRMLFIPNRDKTSQYAIAFDKKKVQANEYVKYYDLVMEATKGDRSGVSNETIVKRGLEFAEHISIADKWAKKGYDPNIPIVKIPDSMILDAKAYDGATFVLYDPNKKGLWHKLYEVTGGNAFPMKPVYHNKQLSIKTSFIVVDTFSDLGKQLISIAKLPSGEEVNTLFAMDSAVKIDKMNLKQDDASQRIPISGLGLVSYSKDVDDELDRDTTLSRQAMFGFMHLNEHGRTFLRQMIDTVAVPNQRKAFKKITGETPGIGEWMFTKLMQSDPVLATALHEGLSVFNPNWGTNVADMFYSAFYENSFIQKKGIMNKDTGNINEFTLSPIVDEKFRDDPFTVSIPLKAFQALGLQEGSKTVITFTPADKGRLSMWSVTVQAYTGEHHGNALRIHPKLGVLISGKDFDIDKGTITILHPDRINNFEIPNRDGFFNAVREMNKDFYDHIHDDEWIQKYLNDHSSEKFLEKFTGRSDYKPDVIGKLSDKRVSSKILYYNMYGSKKIGQVAPLLTWISHVEQEYGSKLGGKEKQDFDNKISEAREFVVGMLDILVNNAKNPIATHVDKALMMKYKVDEKSLYYNVVNKIMSITDKETEKKIIFDFFANKDKGIDRIKSVASAINEAKSYNSLIMHHIKSAIPLSGEKFSPFGLDGKYAEFNSKVWENIKNNRNFTDEQLFDALKVINEETKGMYGQRSFFSALLDFQTTFKSVDEIKEFWSDAFVRFNHKYVAEAKKKINALRYYMISNIDVKDVMNGKLTNRGFYENLIMFKPKAFVNTMDSFENKIWLEYVDAQNKAIQEMEDNICG